MRALKCNRDRRRTAVYTGIKGSVRCLNPCASHLLNLSLGAIDEALAGNEKLTNQLAQRTHATWWNGPVSGRSLHMLRNTLGAFDRPGTHGSMPAVVISESIESARHKRYKERKAACTGAENPSFPSPTREHSCIEAIPASMRCQARPRPFYNRDTGDNIVAASVLQLKRHEAVAPSKSRARHIAEFAGRQP